jgi:hypothetical protein
MAVIAHQPELRSFISNCRVPALILISKANEFDDVIFGVIKDPPFACDRECGYEGGGD